jgi:hypothetical protein
VVVASQLAVSVTLPPDDIVLAEALRVHTGPDEGAAETVTVAVLPPPAAFVPLTV